MTPSAIIEIKGLRKTYASGFEALKDVDLTIRRGEIFALLGPNGAGKTTLISTICGIVTPTAGTVHVDGHDNQDDYHAARKLIGLVPQELTTEAFETVWDTVVFSRGLFGLAPSPERITGILTDLSLIDKKDNRIRELSGGMKRRVLIAKALAHEPRILFLDEPTAGVDVELRRDMWALVRRLQDDGVTIVLTTHYIEEAEEMADRVGVINGGQILLVEDKDVLMRRLGRKELILQLRTPIDRIPDAVRDFDLTLSPTGDVLTYSYDTMAERTGITRLLSALRDAGIVFRDLNTKQSSLEDIFVELVRETRPATDTTAPQEDTAA